MGLELIFGKAFTDPEGRIAQHRTYRHERKLGSGFFGFFHAIASLWQRTFIRRELFIRNTHSTKRIVLERSVQVQLAILGLALIFWMVYSTSGILSGKSSNKIMQERLAETHNAYEAKVSALQKEYEELNLRIFLAEKEFGKISSELSKRHDHLTNLLGMQERVGKKIKKRSKVQNKIKTKARNPRESSLKPMRYHDDVLLHSRAAGPTYSFFPSQAIRLNHDAHTGLVFTKKKGVDKIIRQVIAIDREQRAILDHMEEKMNQKLTSYKRAFADTEAVKADIFVAQVLQFKNASYDPAAVGGPLVAITGPQLNQTAKKKQNTKALYPSAQTGSAKNSLQTRSQMNKVHANLSHLVDLDNAIAYLPLAQPMPMYYITSPFGPRVDPFTREWAFHTGMDIAGKNDTVQATLPGIVTFAGQARGYGKMVEINHGFGVITRYGHLSKVLVRKGQKAKFKQRVGVMGSTGRSTGEHLHYEILVNNKPYDPWKFMEAGKNVFETSH